MKSSKFFRLINTYKIPKRPLRNLQYSYFDVGWIYNFSPQLYSELHREAVHQQLPIDGLSLHQRTVLLVRGWGMRILFAFIYQKPNFQSTRHHQRGVDWPTRRRLPFVDRLSWAVLGTNVTLGPSSRTLRLSLGIFSQMFPTQTCLYISLGSLT